VAASTACSRSSSGRFAFSAYDPSVLPAELCASSKQLAVESNATEINEGAYPDELWCRAYLYAGTPTPAVSSISK
jgi:hypothetical protein